MTASSTPALSVIVLVPDRFGTVAEVVSHLAAQDRRGEIEIVFVTPVDLDVPPDAMTSFQRWQTVRVPDWRSTARARAAGVAAAGSLLVAFVEDHCFPTPGWAHALIEAHRDDWAAVGPVILNANPSFTISWANPADRVRPVAAPLRGGRRSARARAQQRVQAGAPRRVRRPAARAARGRERVALGSRAARLSRRD